MKATDSNRPFSCSLTIKESESLIIEQGSFFTKVLTSLRPSGSMATSSIQQHVAWTTAKLVPEALQHRLHVLEDPPLIQILGQAKFVDMVVFGPVGWQQGVSHLCDYRLPTFFYFVAFLLQIAIQCLG